MPLCFTKDKVGCVERLEQQNKESYKKPRYLTEEGEKDMA